MTESAQSVPYGKPVADKQISLCIAGMAHVILGSSTTQTREMGQELIMDLLVAYSGATRVNDSRSAEEMQAELKQNGYAKFQALYDALPHGKDAAFDNAPERRTVKSIMGMLCAVGAVDRPVQQKPKEVDMTDVLNNDQKKLVKESIRDLNRVQARTKDDAVKTKTQDFIWDLTLLASPEARTADSRSMDALKEDVFAHGRARLAAISDNVGDDEKLLVAAARAMLSVAKLIAPAPERNITQWRDRVVEPKTSERSR